MSKSVILIPTYEEALTVAGLIEALRDLREDCIDKFDLLVIDDNSIDGTAELVEKFALPWVQVMRRPNKGGLGAAYRAGFTKVLADVRYTQVVTMDADGSHRVKDLEVMFAAMTSATSTCAMVLGTRWMPGGSVVNWSRFRFFLSRFANSSAKLALGINLNDLTGGFRIYSVELLNSLNLKELQATGYCFQIEMAMAADLLGAEAIQVPITFVERQAGKSKMNGWIALEAGYFILWNGLKRPGKKKYRR